MSQVAIVCGLVSFYLVAPTTGFSVGSVELSVDCSSLVLEGTVLCSVALSLVLLLVVLSV